jgi:heterodisulfide reductase subunit A
MKENIGVYICTCGPNIGDVLDVQVIVDHLTKEYNIKSIKINELLCSEDGQSFLENDIKKNKIKRAVIAACSPKMYEQKFMTICEKAGCNPYLMSMVNIREQCAWVTEDKNAATEKAKKLIAAAVNRIRLNEPLEKKMIDCNPDVLVIGAGVAGLEASLTLAQKGRNVHLVEKNPFIGGMAVRFEEVYPDFECAPCMLAPMLQEIIQRENIKVYTCSEVSEVIGSFGNFIAKIKKKARYVDESACIGCGACYEPCPKQTLNEYDEYLSNRKAIFVPFAGALPNIPLIDSTLCNALNGKECTFCKSACAFDAIDLNDQDKEYVVDIGAVVIATGARVLDSMKDLFTYGYGQGYNIMTTLQFERLNSKNGATHGNIILANGDKPDSIAFIHCAGREDTMYCSGTCCMTALKLALNARTKSPGTKILEFYRELCMPKKEHQRMYKKAIDQGIDLIQVQDMTRVKPMAKGYNIEYVTVTGDKMTAYADMIVLATPILAGNDNNKIADLFDIPLDEYGFFAAEHLLIKPVSTPLEGIYLAGSCQKPMDIPDAIAQGSATAGKILSKLIPGEKLIFDPCIAECDGQICAECRICISICPYKAISIDPEQACAVVNDTLCRGCGSCAAACPTGALKIKHYTKQEILSEIMELVK